MPGPFGMERLALLDELATNATEFDNGSDLFIVEGVSDTVALTDALVRHEQTAMTVAVGLVGGQIKREWRRFFADRCVFVVADNDPGGLAARQRLRTGLTGVAADVLDVFVPLAHNDIAAWRLVSGEDFAESFVRAVVAALEVAQ